LSRAKAAADISFRRLARQRSPLTNTAKRDRLRRDPLVRHCCPRRTPRRCPLGIVGRSVRVIGSTWRLETRTFKRLAAEERGAAHPRDRSCLAPKGVPLAMRLLDRHTRSVIDVVRAAAGRLADRVDRSSLMTDRVTARGLGIVDLRTCALVGEEYGQGHGRGSPARDRVRSPAAGEREGAMAAELMTAWPPDEGSCKCLRASGGIA
jgi:hypothetical protein